MRRYPRAAVQALMLPALLPLGLCVTTSTTPTPAAPARATAQVPPPSPVSPACQAKLNAFCNDAKLNEKCLEPTLKWYPDASPWVGIVGPSCAGLKCDAQHNCTCLGPAPGTAELRCCSHLALGADGQWSAKAPHPNALCSNTHFELLAIYKACTGHAPPKPPPPPPPPGYANASVTLIPVMVAGAKA
eukprot:COSAG01_NODE_27703_length_679_cov_0.777586_1_plen_187_part_10